MPGKIATPQRTGSAPRASIDSARKRLGGRASVLSTRAPGSVVGVTLRDGTTLPGIVLWSSRAHCDVWFDDGLARRTRDSMVSVHPGPMPDRLARVSAEMRLFSAMAEGDRVRWERAGLVAEGCIVEKCRYGAIVVTRDGRLVAVGFRKLWPVVVRSVA